MMQNSGKQKTGLIVLCLVCSVSAHAAELVLDFMPHDGGSLGISDGTPWLSRGGNALPEIVTDPETGLSYYHIIMGDPASGFMQEVYIQRGFGSFQGGSGSAVGGGGNGGNNVDPLGIDSASGEANPTRVLVRQIVSDGEIYIDFVKDKFNRKPKVTQMLTLPDMTSIFQIDMSNSSYSDNTTPGVLFYTVSLADDYKDGGGFNFATDIEESTITGGRYTYAIGTGPGGSDGTYTYEQGSFDMDAISWDSYFDHSLANPWSITTNRPTPP